MTFQVSVYRVLVPARSKPWWVERCAGCVVPALVFSQLPGHPAVQCFSSPLSLLHKVQVYVCRLIRHAWAPDNMFWSCQDCSSQSIWWCVITMSFLPCSALVSLHTHLARVKENVNASTKAKMQFQDHRASKWAHPRAWCIFAAQIMGVLEPWIKEGIATASA